jgi:hypothetical protein
MVTGISEEMVKNKIISGNLPENFVWFCRRMRFTEEISGSIACPGYIRLEFKGKRLY